jgi:hypothetical protein
MEDGKDEEGSRAARVDTEVQRKVLLVLNSGVPC